jgi:4'-phosphopantetheinyl transferase
VRLGPDEVHVWSVPLTPSPAERAALGDLLSGEERERGGRFRFPRDRESFAAARGWLRRLLGSYCGRQPGELEFGYGPRGKPRLADEGAAGVCFNLAHSCGRALIAVARGREVGVDLEGVERAVDWDRLARRFFTPRETEAIAGRGGDARLAFMACWTRKEAYLKARGDGLAVPLDSFEVSIDPEEEVAALRTPADPGEASRWTLHSFRPAPGFIAALAISGGGARVRRLTAETEWTPSIRSAC